jgi:hypothetical protein
VAHLPDDTSTCNLVLLSRDEPSSERLRHEHDVATRSHDRAPLLLSIALELPPGQPGPLLDLDPPPEQPRGHHG